jgi:pimeloyl-ACP methyl ester carboxylesterase
MLLAVLMGGWPLVAAVTTVALASASTTPQDERPTRIRVGDIELHFIERGTGAPLVLLHGGQADYRAWPRQVEAFAPRYRVISYSRRYHYPNANTPTATDHSALVDADDLAGLIRQLRLPPAHLVGTSYGAFTALALATRQPALVRSLVLAEPPIHRWVETDSRGAALYNAFRTGVMAPAAAAFAAGDRAGAMRIFIDAFDGAGTFDGLPAERRAAVLQNAGFFRALTASSDPFPNLSKDVVRLLRVPVLIVRGAETDELHRLVTEELGRVLPRAERTIIPNAGHGSQRQNPEAFNRAVSAFLDRVK